MPDPEPTPAPVAFDIATAPPDEIVKAAGGFQRLIPNDFVVDYKGKPTPAKDVPFFAEPKALKDFFSSAYEAHKGFGERVKIPPKDARPDEISAFKQRVRDSGLYVEKPYPETPDKYEVKPPDGFDLDPKAVDSVRQVLHKHGIPQEAANELMGIYFEQTKDMMPAFKELQGLVPILKQTKEESMKEFEESIKRNAHEPEQVKAMIGRYAAKRFNQEQLATMGDLGNHPVVLQIIYENAMANGEPLNAAEMGAITQMSDEDSKYLKEVQTQGTELNKQWTSRGPEAEPVRAKMREIYQRQTGGR